MGPQREQRLVFGEVAELYDRYRPHYPAAAFDRIVDFARLVAGDRVLEVGCGTGRATLPLAERGFLVTALEPSPEMASLAAERTARFPGVELVLSAFETWRPGQLRFRLLLSAQSWHWVSPKGRYQRAAVALAPGGALGLMWNAPTKLRPEALRAALDQAYLEVAPRLAAVFSAKWEIDPREEIRDSGLFEDPVRLTVPWTATYSKSEYLRLLETQSDHRMLPQPTLERLVRAIGDAIDQHGGLVEQDYSTLVFLAHRHG